MSPELESTTMSKGHPPRRKTGFHFPAAVGRFDDAADRAVFDELARWVEDYFREDLQRRPSKHVYIRKLPADVIAEMNRLRDNPGDPSGECCGNSPRTARSRR